MGDERYIIGPYGGEFGYELCYWIPYVRHFVDRVNFVDGEVVCLVRPERSYFYKGVECDIYEVELNKKYDDWMYNHQDLVWDNPEDTIEDFPSVEAVIKDSIGISYENAEKVIPSEELWSEPRRWVRYDEYIPQNDRYDIIIHMRNKGDDRDIPISGWYKIVDFFSGRSETVGVIGTMNDHVVEGVEDLRGATPDNLCHYVTQADVCLGAISGPMHLVSLCGTEYIVGGNPNMPIPEVGTSIEAFKRKWNPFNTHVTYISKDRFVSRVTELF